VADPVTDQDHLTAHRPRLGQELTRHLQGAVGTPGPGHRDQIGGELRHLGGDGLGVARQGGDQEGFGAEGDQGHLALLGRTQQVQELEARPGQPRRPDIRRVHAG